MVSAIDQAIQQSPGRFAWTSDEGAAHVHLASNSGEPLATWVYAWPRPLPPWPTKPTWPTCRPPGRAVARSRCCWARMTPKHWPCGGKARHQSPTRRGTLQIVPAGELISRLWDSRPAWTILPFDALTPELKVLRLAGQSPLDKEFDPAGIRSPLTWA